MNSSLRVLANFIDLINLHLQMTVGAHIVRPFALPPCKSLEQANTVRLYAWFLLPLISCLFMNGCNV